MDIPEQAQQKAGKMLKGLEPLLNGERPRELGWFSLESRRLRVMSSVCMNNQWGGARLFSVVLSNRTRGHGPVLKYRKIHLNSFTVRVIKHWNRLSSEAVESPSLEKVKTCLDIILGNLH